MVKYAAQHRSRRQQPRRLLLLICMTATAIAFLAPVAEAAPTTLTVTKTGNGVDTGSIVPGQTITYNITIQNGAGDVATVVTLTDVTPAGTTYVADSATINGNQVTGPTNPFEDGEPIPDIPVNGSATASFTVTVDSPQASGTSIDNTATASASNAPAANDSTTHNVASAPSLTVTKTANPPESGPVLPGDEIEYTIVVTNTASATDTATGVRVRDVTPTNTTYVANSARENGSAIPGGTTNPFEPGPGYLLADSTLDPGESETLTFRVEVNTPLPNTTAINNTATATATNGPGPVSDTANHTVASAPGLTVSKTSSPSEGGPVTPGTTITYTVVVTNDALATETATGVSLADATPANTTYVAGSARLDGATVPDNTTGPPNPFEGGEVLADMAPGDSVTATFQVVANRPLDNGLQIANTATVSSNELPDASDGATLTVQSAPQLSIVKTSAPAEGGRVTPGTTINYTIVVANAATATEIAKNLDLLDPTPVNTAYVEGSGRLNGAVVTGAGNPFGTAFDLPNLNPGQTHTITFSARVSSPLARGTVVSNLARLTGENHPNLQDTATHTVDSAPVLKLTLSASPPSGTKLDAGDVITYRIDVANDPAATESLRNVVVSAPTPHGTLFIDGTARLDGARVNAPTGVQVGTALAAPGPFPGGYELGTMAPGTSHRLSYNVLVKPTAAEITSTVRVTADNAAAIASLRHRGPNNAGAAGGSGDGDGEGDANDGGGDGAISGGGDGGITTGPGVNTGDDLAFTGLDLIRLLLLAITLLLAGWALVARGRAVQRRTAAGHVDDPVPSTGSATVDRWVDAWFYSEKRR
jgi:large repetitive protein